MAVEQREAGIIRHKIDLHLLVAAYQHNVLDETGHRLPGHSRQFETAAVQVDRMDVVAGVAHAQPVAFALLHAKQRMHVIFRECDIVDGPAVEATLGCVLLGKGHFDDLIRRWNRRRWISELSVVPVERLGRDLLCLTLLAGIFNYHTHAVLPVVVRHIAHDPNAGMVHLDNGGDSLRRA